MYLYMKKIRKKSNLKFDISTIKEFMITYLSIMSNETYINCIENILKSINNIIQRGYDLYKTDDNIIYDNLFYVYDLNKASLLAALKYIEENTNYSVTIFNNVNINGIIIDINLLKLVKLIKNIDFILLSMPMIWIYSSIKL